MLQNRQQDLVEWPIGLCGIAWGIYAGEAVGSGMVIMQGLQLVGSCRGVK